MDEVTTQIVSADEDGLRLDQWLARRLDSLSRSRLKRLIEAGRVLRAGETICDPSYHVKPGEEVTVRVPPPVAPEPRPEALALAVVYEDADVIVIDKPAGLVVHPAAGNRTGTLVNALIHHCGDSLSGIGGVMRPGIVHRLDKDTSGLLVAAKNDLAHQALSKQFNEHSIDRMYKAMVWGCPRPLVGTVALPLKRAPYNRQKRAVATTSDPSAKPAVTHYRVLRKFGDDARPAASLVECRLETGRTHQIRVHLAHISHPVLGDPIYGGARKLPASHQAEKTSQARKPDRREDVGNYISGLTGQMLHACRLGFLHPGTGEKLEFETGLPDAFEKLIGKLELL